MCLVFHINGSTLYILSCALFLSLGRDLGPLDHQGNPDGHLDCFQSFAVLNKVAVNCLVHGSFHTCLYLWRNSYKWNCWVKDYVHFNFSLHTCYTNFWQLWSLLVKKWKKLPPPLTPNPCLWWSCSFFVFLPFADTSLLALGCSSQSHPCLPDPGSPLLPLPRLFLLSSLRRDFLTSAQSLGWHWGS